ncbi:hypothetical protein RSOL_286080 [Rhizoctonia solani AG-3 Rhs1AP]|nr:hypothetical protein RSOL_286080 [Rhizoctonia solani AG-3 Rhs1AP]KEP46048.1 hypothetical protein V565_221560 [Rhizoctonia solani 123E]
MRPSDNAITVELPRLNPFGEAPSRNRSGGQSGGHSGGRQPAARSSRRYQSDEHDEFEDEEYDARRTNVTQLPNVNPFGREEPSRGNRQGGQSGARQSVRRQARVRSDDDEEDGGIVNLPHVNPFAAGGNRNPPRIIEPVYPPDEPEPEEEDFEEEEMYSPPPVPRSARTLDNSRPSLRTSNLDRPQANGRQRAANSRNQRPSAGPQEDDRLVISWVDEALASPPRSPAHRHGHHHSS